MTVGHDKQSTESEITGFAHQLHWENAPDPGPGTDEYNWLLENNYNAYWLGR